MIRVKLKSAKGYDYYVLALQKEDYDQIAEVRALKREGNTLPEDLPMIDIEGIEFHLDQVVMYGTTKDITEEQSRQFVPKVLIDEERKSKRHEFLASIETDPTITIEEEFYQYTCYAYAKPGGHRSPLSGFRCALEQINYPTYALVYRERTTNGTV